MRPNRRYLAIGAACAATLAVAGTAVATTSEVTGFDATTIERIDRAVSGVFTASNSPGYAVGVWIPGVGSYQRAYGVASRKTGAPLQLEDRFRIGSLTKTLTGVAVLRLVDQGKLALDDRLASFVPGIPYGNRITIRQLLGMRAGVFDFTGTAWFQRTTYFDLLVPWWTPQTSIDLIRRGRPPQYPPGTSGRYDNSNFVLLGRVIERATGRAATDVIHDEVLVPAGLASTTLATRTGMPGPFRRGYETGLDGRLRDTTIQNPQVAWTAGNAISTVADLGTWGRVLGTGALLSPALRDQQMRGTHLSNESRGATYGLAISIIPGGWRGHSGYIHGYNSAVYYQPTTGVTIATTGNLGADDAVKAVIRVLPRPGAMTTGR